MLAVQWVRKTVTELEASPDGGVEARRIEELLVIPVPVTPEAS